MTTARPPTEIPPGSRRTTSTSGWPRRPVSGGGGDEIPTANAMGLDHLVGQRLRLQSAVLGLDQVADGLGSCGDPGMKIPANIKPEWIEVAVDTREQQPVDVSPMVAVSATLATGDYGLLAMPEVCDLERKILSDLLGVIGKGRDRFEREIDRLVGYPVRGIFIESSWEELEAGCYRSEVTPAAAIGSLLGWAARGIPIFMCGDHIRCGKFITRVLFTAARRRWRESRALLARLDVEPGESPTT